MVLRHEPDVAHAAWHVDRDESWVDLSCWGPSGYAAYAKVLHLPPELIGDEQEEMNAEGDLTDDRLAALVEVLARHTLTPGDCFFGMWDGFGELYGGVMLTLLRPGHAPSPQVRTPPAFPREVVEGPKVSIPARDYLLFRGALAEAGEWGAAHTPDWPGRINSPNLMWPQDRAWFVATEIDQPWTGVGGTEALVTDLLAAPGLDVERR